MCDATHQDGTVPGRATTAAVATGAGVGVGAGSRGDRDTDNRRVSGSGGGPPFSHDDPRGCRAHGLPDAAVRVSGLPPRCELEGPTRLSHSIIWRLMDEFYQRQGAAAWSRVIVPSFITSNAFIARAYASMAVAFWADEGRSGRLSTDVSAPLYALEVGAGSGKFSFHLAVAFRELAASPSWAALGARRVVVVLTDLCESNVAAWEKHPRLQELAREGLVDFAVFDAAQDTDPAAEDVKLHLRVSGVRVLRYAAVWPTVGSSSLTRSRVFGAGDCDEQ